MASAFPRNRRIHLFWGFTLLLVLIPAGIGYWNAWETSSRMSRLKKEDLTGLKVWGGGIRTAGNTGFCGCAMVPKPERVFYETKDPAEVRELVSLLRARPYLDLGPIVANCGQITIDFMRGDECVYWIHLNGRNLRSGKGFLPVSSGSYEDLQDWLKQRSVQEKISAALLQTPRK